MKIADKGFKPTLYTSKRGEISLSGFALQEFLQAVLSRGAAFRFQAKGFSMCPFIKDRDVVTVYPLAGVWPRLGEIVIFILPETGKPVMHRVVGQRGDYYFIKGDSVSGSGAFIRKENILGRVAKVERDHKNISLGLGPERYAIAFLSRIRPLSLLFLSRKLSTLIFRRLWLCLTLL